MYLSVKSLTNFFTIPFIGMCAMYFGPPMSGIFGGDESQEYLEAWRCVIRFMSDVSKYGRTENIGADQ